MPAQITKAPPTRTRTRRTNKPAPPAVAAPSPAPAGRTADGRFTKDNPGGPGNPHARHCARMLALLRASISDEEMVAIFRALVEKAVDGDISAAKLIMTYKLGKPAAAPNPDEIDRDEWEHYQRDTIQLQDVQQVLGSLPSSVGNDLARTVLPAMTQARKDGIAGQLAKNRPAARKVTKDNKVATDNPQNVAPIANGNSGDDESSINDPRFTTSDQRSPIHVGLTPRRSPSSIPDSRSTTNDVPPIPIGNSGNNKSQIHDSRPAIHDPRPSDSLFTIHVGLTPQRSPSSIHGLLSMTNDVAPIPIGNSGASEASIHDPRSTTNDERPTTIPATVALGWVTQSAACPFRDVFR